MCSCLFRLGKLLLSTIMMLVLCSKIYLSQKFLAKTCLHLKMLWYLLNTYITRGLRCDFSHSFTSCFIYICNMMFWLDEFIYTPFFRMLVCCNKNNRVIIQNNGIDATDVTNFSKMFISIMHTKSTRKNLFVTVVYVLLNLVPPMPWYRITNTNIRIKLGIWIMTQQKIP